MTEDEARSYYSSTIVSLSLSGPDYSTELEENIREELSDLALLNTRGFKAPACGPALSFNVVIDFFSAVPSDIRSAIVSLIVIRIYEILRRNLLHAPVMSGLTFSESKYDIVFDSVGDDGIEIPSEVIASTINKVEDFIRREASEGNDVLQVRIPRRILDRQECQATPFDQNTNIWEITYRKGKRQFTVTYDSVNDCFLNS